MLIPLIVLNDGETFGGLDGASIILLTPEQHQKLHDGNTEIGEIEPVAELLLQDTSLLKGGGS